MAYYEHLDSLVVWKQFENGPFKGDWYEDCSIPTTEEDYQAALAAADAAERSTAAQFLEGKLK
jgi:hypothetical protein